MRNLKRAIEWVVTLSLGVWGLYKVLKCKHNGYWMYSPIENENVLARCWGCGRSVVITVEEFAEIFRK
jgi:hypothetical protein